MRGLRESTVDVDLTFEPENDDVLRKMVALKERLNLNVELLSDSFIYRRGGVEAGGRR